MPTNDRFDLGELAELLQDQEPERHELALHLATLKGRFEVRRAYVQILATADASHTHHSESIELEHPTEGTLVLDITNDGKLIGIEMINTFRRGRCKEATSRALFIPRTPTDENSAPPITWRFAVALRDRVGCALAFTQTPRLQQRRALLR